MEETFLRFEVQVVELRHLEDIVNCATMIVESSMGSDTDIIHVDANGGTEGFMFEDGVTIDDVHHSLECRWRIGKSEVHDRGFKKAISGFKRCLGFVAFADAYIVIPPADIELRIDVCVAEVANKICDEREGVLISNCKGIDFSIILYWS